MRTHRLAVRRPSVPRGIRGTAALAGLVLAASAGYTVRPGDTLSSIALRSGVPVRQLAQANGIADPDRIVAGQHLRVSQLAREAAVHRGTHVVVRGETLSGIAARYGTTPAAIAAANGLANRNRIVVGQRLTIPGGATAGESVAASSPDGAPPGPGRVTPAGVRARRPEVERLLHSTAQRYGWRPDTVKALAYLESGWNNAVVSAKGARGIMQVLPGTGRDMAARVGRPLDLSDPADNVEAGVAYLDYLFQLTGGDVRRTIGSYYQGPSSVARNGLLAETERYVDNVMALRTRFR